MRTDLLKPNLAKLQQEAMENLFSKQSPSQDCHFLETLLSRFHSQWTISPRVLSFGSTKNFPVTWFLSGHTWVSAIVLLVTATCVHVKNLADLQVYERSIFSCCPWVRYTLTCCLSDMVSSHWETGCVQNFLYSTTGLGHVTVRYSFP